MIHFQRALDRAGLLQRIKFLSDKFYITDFEELRISSLVTDAEQADIRDWYKTLGGKDLRTEYLRIFMRNVHSVTKGNLEDRKAFYEQKVQPYMDDPNKRYLANYLALNEETWRLAMSVVRSYDAYDNSTVQDF